MIFTIKLISLYLLITFFTLYANISIKIMPIKKLLSKVTNNTTEIDNTLNPTERGRLSKIINIIDVISNHVPWRVKCFEQALTTLYMAKILNIDLNVFFGVQREIDGKINAHAWTKSGGRILTGFDEHEKYTVVLTRSYKKRDRI